MKTAPAMLISAQGIARVSLSRSHCYVFRQPLSHRDKMRCHGFRAGTRIGVSCPLPVCIPDRSDVKHQQRSVTVLGVPCCEQLRDDWSRFGIDRPCYGYIVFVRDFLLTAACLQAVALGLPLLLCFTNP